MNYETGADFAHDADANDHIATYRSRFSMPESTGGRECVYLCGHSLGLMPYTGRRSLEQELDAWAELGVRGHFAGNRPWLSFHRNAQEGFGQLCGALPSEVVAMNSLTVNLHLMLHSFYRPRERRTKILIESMAFPSDRFAVESQIASHGLDPREHLVEWRPPAGSEILDIEDLEGILQAEGDSIALLLLPGIQYYSGQVLDMEALCQLARRHGCYIGLDLAHAIGNVELQLNRWQPDFAVWCSYKYLNGGPGAVGGAFVASHHHDADVPRLDGWWGHDEASRLEMSPVFSRAKGADGWQLSTVSVFAVAPLTASLAMFREATLEALLEKSRNLTGYLAWLLQYRFGDRITVITPEAAHGAQLSISVNDPSIAARNIPAELEKLNVIVDWREPNVIRMAPAPLYNSFLDAWEFCERLEVLLRPT